MKKPRFDVISIYYDNRCNMSPKCPFCYMANKPLKGIKPRKFWLELPKYLAGMTEQVAFAGYEPLLHPSFVAKFSKACRQYGIIPNITTNGLLIPKMTIAQIRDTMGALGMVSISVDHHKVQDREGLHRLRDSVKKLNSAGIRVGINWLLREESDIAEFLEYSFNTLGVHSVFLLHQKPYVARLTNKQMADIQKCSLLYKHLYVDDFILKVITEGTYGKWKKPCHYGREAVSISPDGGVSGCSFTEPVFYLKKPSDALKLKSYKFKARYKCICEEEK